MFEPLNTNVLYRYRDDSSFTEDIILKHSLWFCTPSVFNDPFDCWGVAKDADDERMKQWLHTYMLKNSTLTEVPDNTFNDIKAILQSPNALKNCVDEVLAKIRICCFSLNCNSILMWSHYADKHTGMCFEFNVENDRTLFNSLDKIDYVNNIQPIDVLDLYEVDKFAQYFIHSKYTDWRYEEEVRCIKFGECVDLHSNGQFFEFHPSALRKIIFGCKASPSTIEKYKRLCSVDECKHVQFSQMEQMEDGTFGLREKLLQ